ncbi:hypothetical protein RHOER0001_6599 [Rhodococcus erythropolis SK121]|nr:hypothetical protein RHOER0001_6599 [Rhodococcus erythropolis SK121]
MHPRISLSNSANGSGIFPISGVEASIEVTSLSDAFEVVVYREITEIRVEGLKPRR